MDREPIWRLLHQCAIDLTRAGSTPFTRGDLIACVQKKAPQVGANSINPIIQGITDNLRGGAPGADGKRILHSVGRGRFVLLSGHRDAEQAAGDRASASDRDKAAPDDDQPPLPRSEGEFRDALVSLLDERLRDSACVVEREGRIRYRLPTGAELAHAADIVVSAQDSKKRVSIELKYQSAVTDQFKCRAYDAIHTKREHGDRMLTVMVYARAGSGISAEHARSICYPFDRFYAGPARQFMSPHGIEELAGDIEAFLFGKSNTIGG